MLDAQSILKTSLHALGTPADIERINTISAIAECTSPRGSYTTEIHSGRGGRVWFKQTWANRNPFAIVVNPQGAWATDTVTNKTETLDNASISMIRGHEFQMLPLTLAERYSSPALEGKAEWNGEACFSISALDDLGLPCHLFFRQSDLRWEGMSLTDSRHPEAKVNVIVNEWSKIDGVSLPSRVTATDSAGDFCLDFKKISINTVGGSLFEVPNMTESVMGLADRG